MKKKILIVEDDNALLPLVSYNLEKSGFDVLEAKTGEEVLLILKETTPDLILLDWMIPSPNGLEICKIIRNKNEIKHLPIIILTARGEEEDKVKGLNTGADDYIVKPFKPSELIARINALLRRATSAFAESKIEFDDIELNTNEHKVIRSKKRIHLGPTEYKLLKFFLENPGRVYSREQLLNAVWGHGIFVELRTVDTHIRRLRKAINIGGSKDIIRTVRAAGYSLDID